MCEDLVTRLVAECVVDDLEVVEVAKQHRDDVARATGLGQRVFEPVAQQRSVREAGEAVVECLVGELTRQLALGGDVVGVEHDAPDRGVLQKVRVARLERQPAPVGMTEPAGRGDGPAR